MAAIRVISGALRFVAEPAAAADNQALQQSRSFARWAGPVVLAPGLGCLGQAPQVVLVGVPGDVARMRIGDEGGPGVPGLQHVAGAAVGAAALAAPAVGEGTGVAGVGEDVRMIPPACSL